MLEPAVDLVSTKWSVDACGRIEIASYFNILCSSRADRVAFAVEFRSDEARSRGTARATATD